MNLAIPKPEVHRTPPVRIQDLDRLERIFARYRPDGKWEIPHWLIEMQQPYGIQYPRGFYVINWADHGLKFPKEI